MKHCVRKLQILSFHKASESRMYLTYSKYKLDHTSSLHDTDIHTFGCVHNIISVW